MTIEERLEGLRQKSAVLVEEARVKPGFKITDSGELQLNKEGFAALDTHHVIDSETVLRGDKEVTVNEYGKDRLTIAEDNDDNLLLIVGSGSEIYGNKTVKLGKTTRKAKQTALAPIFGTLMDFFGIDQMNHTENQFVIDDIITNAEHSIAIIRPANPLSERETYVNDTMLDDGLAIEVDPLEDRDIEKHVVALVEEMDIPQEIERIAHEQNLEEPVSMVSYHDTPEIPVVAEVAPIIKHFDEA